MSHHASLNDKRAKQLAEDVFDVDQRTLDLRAKCFGALEKTLPAKTIVRWLQLDRRSNSWSMLRCPGLSGHQAVSGVVLSNARPTMTVLSSAALRHSGRARRTFSPSTLPEQREEDQCPGAV